MGNKIVLARELAPQTKLFEIEAEHIARRGKAGQFVILRVSDQGERIPLTIAHRDVAKGTITIVAQEVGKRMLARAKGAAPGTFTGGRIVHIASMAGLRVLGQIGVYSMSKAAVIHMTRAMALEWGRFGINVNALCPGYIDTEINHHHWQTEQGRKLIDMLPRKRVGQPQDLDSVLMMLVANESHFINGAVIQADDGFAV